MMPIPWTQLIEVLRFALWIALWVNVIKLFQVIIVEVFSKHCRHCGKRV